MRAGRSRLELGRLGQLLVCGAEVLGGIGVVAAVDQLVEALADLAVVSGRKELLVEGIPQVEHLLLVLPQVHREQRRALLDDPQGQQLAVGGHALAVEPRDAAVEAVGRARLLEHLAMLVAHALVRGHKLLQRGDPLVERGRAVLLEDLESLLGRLLVEAQGRVVAPVLGGLLVHRQGDGVRVPRGDLEAEHVDVEQPAVDVLHLGGGVAAVLVQLVAQNEDGRAHGCLPFLLKCVQRDSSALPRCASRRTAGWAHMLHRTNTAPRPDDCYN